MTLELIVIIQNAIFILMDSIICGKAISKKIKTKTQRTFLTFAIETTLLQISFILGKMFQYRMVIVNNQVLQYIIYSTLMILMPLCAFSWFKYFLYTIPDRKAPNLLIRIVYIIPVVLMVVACILSPWTHWVFYIDENLLYQRGTVFSLQVVCPYLYWIFACVVIVVCLFKKKGKELKNSIMNFASIIIPSMIGAVLQIYVYSGGYTQIGVSFGLLLMYLSMYVEEIKEAERLQSLDEINKKLISANDRISSALGVIEGLSQEYHTIFIVDTESLKISLVRSNGKSTIRSAVDMALSSETFEDAISSYIDSYVMEQDREHLLEALSLQKVLNHVKNSKEIYTVNYLRNAPDGSVGYHQIAVVDATAEGSRKKFVFGFRDVDAVVKAEIQSRNELLQQKQRVQLQLETVADAIHGGFKIGGPEPDYEFNFVSKQFAAMLGYTVEELYEVSKGKMINIIDSEAAAKELSNAKESVAKGEMYTMNFRIKCKNGSWKNVEDRGRKIITADGKSEYWSFISDKDEITEKTQALVLARTANLALEESKAALEKARKTAEAANNAKTAFLFNMSHDIRTPMNAIMGFTSLLESHQEEPEKRSDYLKKIKDASTVLLSIINNVLEMARIEKGTLELSETVWYIDQFNETIYSVFFEMMNQKEIEYTRSVNVQHHYVYCDAIKIREIFLNILSNAFKYTLKGGKVHWETIELPYDKEGWGMFQTTISDTGIGMSEEFIPHIFEEFSREKNTTAAKIEGTGLGMPIVKRLLELMDGTIEVKSKKDVGTTFIIKIPHKLADKSKIVEHAGVEIDPELFSGKRILLAEDNELNAEIAKTLLVEAGMFVETADNGEQCVKMMEESAAGYYDLILMDIQMPVMNGYEATRYIRGMQNHVKAQIPIIAMTANAFEEDRQEAIKSGMNGHIAKPVNVSDMMSELAITLS